MRVGDAERDKVIAALKLHTADGRLTLEEFADRTEVALGARTDEELALVLSDLPAAPAKVEEGVRRKPTKRTVAFLGGSKRDGRWRVSGKTSVIAILGGAELDLRDAEIDGDVVDIKVTAFMGGVTIHVPPGVEVELRGFSFLGGRQTKLRSDRRVPNAPLIRVNARCVMGGMEVTDRPRRPDRSHRRDHADAVHAAVSDALVAAAERVRVGGPAGRGQASRSAPGVPGSPGPGSPGSPGSHGAPGFPPLPPLPMAPHRIASAAIVGAAEAVARAFNPQQPQPSGATGSGAAPTLEPAPEGTVTVLFTDLRGSTEMTERLGDVAAAALIRRHNELIDRAVREHGGRVVKTVGDGFMVAFTGAGRALECAIAIQRSLALQNDAHPEEPLDVRMGLHTGEAVREGDDLLGRTVIVAARMMDAAAPGQILVSALVRELVASTGTFIFGPPAEVELKGLAAAQLVYPVRW